MVIEDKNSTLLHLFCAEIDVSRVFINLVYKWKRILKLQGTTYLLQLNKQ